MAGPRFTRVSYALTALPGWFEAALDELAHGDLINQVLEITLDDDVASDIAVRRYKLPA